MKPRTASAILCLTFGLMLQLSGIVIVSQSKIIMVPDQLRVRYGNTNTELPFYELRSNVPIRYQQVFSSQAFSNLPPGGLYITTINLRTECKLTRGQLSRTNFNIWFSTTSKEPDQLSSVFDENIGPDVVQVRGRHVHWGLDNGGRPNGTPEIPMGPRIDLDVPFAYDPAEGNLLMEIQIKAEEGNPINKPFLADAEFVAGDYVSRIAARS